MSILRFMIAAASGLVLSPLLVFHCCNLSSRIVEIPLIVFSGLLLPCAVFLTKNKKWSWGIAAACPGIALMLTLIYLSFLHTTFFPVSFLDESAKPRPPVVVDLSKIIPDARTATREPDGAYFLRGSISRSDFNSEIIGKLKMSHRDELLTIWPTAFQSEYDWWQPKSINDDNTYFSTSGAMLHLARYEDGVLYLKNEKIKAKKEEQVKRKTERWEDL